MIVIRWDSKRRNKGAKRVWQLYNDRPAACTGNTTRLRLRNERENKTDIEKQWNDQTHHPMRGKRQSNYAWKTREQKKPSKARRGANDKKGFNHHCTVMSTYLTQDGRGSHVPFQPFEGGRVMQQVCTIAASTAAAQRRRCLIVSLNRLVWYVGGM